jgi:hypothetical protein
VIFPAAEQHRKDYVFLVPSTFSQNYFVLAKPVTGNFTVDGASLGEFPNCVRAPVGTVRARLRAGHYAISPGAHTVEGDQPPSVYGYTTSAPRLRRRRRQDHQPDRLARTTFDFA